MLVYSAERHGGTSPKFARKFANGSGLKIRKIDNYKENDWACFGSPHTCKSLSTARKRGDVWFYGDHAYIGRMKYYRITKNAFQLSDMKQGVPMFCKNINSSIKIKPWIKDGNHILVCPPDNIIASLMGFNECDWLTDVLKKLENNTDRKILVRARDKSKLTSIKQY